MKALKKLLTNLNNNNNNNSNNKTVNNANKNKRKNKKRNKRRKTRILVKNNPVRQAAYSAIPMAVPVSYRRYFTMKNLGETAVRISGCDLIYKIPDNLQTLNDTSVITIIPANPAYWTGTRIAAIAQGYQNYRPVTMRIHYCPQCPVTQQGNVIGGTLWDDVPSVDSMQQSLKTSNGGFLTQCYQPISTTVRMKSNLQINLYRMAGDINQQSNPFYFISLAIATYNSNNQLINPGIFYVEYSYILKNPIGSSTQFKNTGIIIPNQNTSYYTNAVALTCKQLQINSAQYPPGTRINVEFNAQDQKYHYFYNDTPIEQPNIPVWVFMNQPISVQQQQAVEQQPPIIKYQATFVPEGQITITPKHAYLYQEEGDDDYELVMNTGSTQVELGLISAPIVYSINLLEDTIQGYIEYKETSQNFTLSYYNVQSDVVIQAA